MHLRGARLRGALGHAVGAGAPTLPRRHLPVGTPRPLRRGQRRAAPHPARRDPNGGAHRARRGLRGRRRRGAPARAAGGDRPGTARSGARRVAARLRRRHRALQDDRQVGLAGGQAAGDEGRTRARAGRPARGARSGAGLPARPRRGGALGGRPGHGQAPARPRGADRRRPGRAPARHGDAAVWARRAGRTWPRWPAARTPTRSAPTGRPSRSGTRRRSARTWWTPTNWNAMCCACPSR